jgi:hypothetical protein
VEPVVLTAWINLSALWKIIVIGLLAGAGLPALFAVGLKALSLGPANATVTAGGPTATGSSATGSSASAEGDDAPMLGGSVAGMLAGGLCFAVVLAGIGYGIYFVVAGS